MIIYTVQRRWDWTLHNCMEVPIRCRGIRDHTQEKSMDNIMIKKRLHEAPRPSKAPTQRALQTWLVCSLLLLPWLQSTTTRAFTLAWSNMATACVTDVSS